MKNVNDSGISMNQLFYTVFFVTLFGLSSISFVHAVDENVSESDIAIPDIIIDFTDDKYWYGLEPGETQYWKIEDGV